MYENLHIDFVTWAKFTTISLHRVVSNTIKTFCSRNEVNFVIIQTLSLLTGNIEYVEGQPAS